MLLMMMNDDDDDTVVFFFNYYTLPIQCKKLLVVVGYLYCVIIILVLKLRNEQYIYIIPVLH